MPSVRRPLTRHCIVLSSDGHVRQESSPFFRDEDREVISDLSRAIQNVKAVEGTGAHVCLISRMTQMPLGKWKWAVGLPLALWDSFFLLS